MGERFPEYGPFLGTFTWNHGGSFSSKTNGSVLQTPRLALMARAFMMGDKRLKTHSARNKVLPELENVTLWKQIVQWNAPIKVVMAGGSKFFRIATPKLKHTARQLG